MPLQRVRWLLVFWLSGFLKTTNGFVALLNHLASLCVMNIGMQGMVRRVPSASRHSPVYEGARCSGNGRLSGGGEKTRFFDFAQNDESRLTRLASRMMYTPGCVGVALRRSAKPSRLGLMTMRLL